MFILFFEEKCDCCFFGTGCESRSDGMAGMRHHYLFCFPRVLFCMNKTSFLVAFNQSLGKAWDDTKKGDRQKGQLFFFFLNMANGKLRTIGDQQNK